MIVYFLVINSKRCIYPESRTSMFELSNNGDYELRNINLNYAFQNPNANFLKKSIGYSSRRL